MGYGCRGNHFWCRFLNRSLQFYPQNRKTEHYRRTETKGKGMRKAFIHALRGIHETFQNERNFKIHTVIAAVILFTGWWSNLSPGEWLWLSLSFALVFGMELLNTAIETLCDIVSPTYHPLIRKAKDAAAGAVLVTAV